MCVYVLFASAESVVHTLGYDEKNVKGNGKRERTKNKSKGVKLERPGNKIIAMLENEGTCAHV